MTMTPFHEIIDALQSDPEAVARRYAPDGHVDGGRYWALDPGRDDRKIGSFYVNLRGNYCGRWRDEATGEQGDMLDLIQRAERCDRPAALEEARRFLGLGAETAEQRTRRIQRQNRAAQKAEREAEEDAEKRARRARQAHAIWLEARDDIENTPVASYLAGRCIGLDSLGRAPNVLRFHPKLRYWYRDKRTRQVTQGEYPAMVALIHGGYAGAGTVPPVIGIHKTYLAPGPNGHWGKAPVPKAKLVMGGIKGGFIRLWTGQGPRGDKGAPLSRAPQGSRIYVAEGIEDALSAVVLTGGAIRAAAGVSLGNLRDMLLPPAVTDIVLVGDNDADPVLRQTLVRTAEVFAAQGRTVRLRLPAPGFKDLNDELIAATRAAAEQEKTG